ncbi:PepSY domain-containing protein [Candidatus Aalborgicola defluviihabitans]|uniref:PepSY domain-containing protein n=1 Tax=Candidatus Aalborgicola defluviihabitans TaxID=3386187 RepID=UPI00390AF295|nr:PepSY domain-containing protein [Burkholderiales bacterium]
MTRYSKFSLLAIAVTAAIAAAGTVAYAANGGLENDAIAINKAKISLVQAVTVAEQHANGKASQAAFENSKQGWVYDVEVVSGAKVFDVRVDADKGTVISSTEDKADRDDDHDEQD